MVSIKKITRNGKALILAYDQGLEHGPEMDFNCENIDPLYIINIAKKGKYTAVAFQKGICEKYKDEIKKSKVPLIVKLNGKTKLVDSDPYSTTLCTVSEAIKLGASAVGFTLFPGSIHEPKIFSEFEKIQKEAHENNLPVVAWIYPRGKNVKDDISREILSYATRVGLELGADLIKIKSGGKKEDISWAVKSAGKVKVVIAGGAKLSEEDFLKEVKNDMDAGAIGLAVGRNVWQSNDPVSLTKKISKIIFSKSKTKKIINIKNKTIKQSKK
jgi:class I fructose-bisphosphate aldolase